MESYCSSASNQKNKVKTRKPEGIRIPKSEFDIINEKLRSIHCPLVDLPRIHYEAKFLGRYRLYVGNISNAVSKDDLEGLFKVFGEISDVFIQQNKNFGFVRMDYFHNALKAKQQLNGCVLKDRKIYITFSPQASITVKHLSPTVSNELLYIAFAVFGDIEYSFINTDKYGKSTGEGVVDFMKKSSAAAAKKYCSEHMFFLTSSLRPIIIEDYVPPPDINGLPEELVRKTRFFYEERTLSPRFAVPGSFEFKYAQRFKELWENFNIKFNMLKAEQESEEHKLEIELMRVKYDHETESLKDMIRQRELEKERYCQNLEDKSRLLDEGSNIACKSDNFFMQANQLNNMLNSEEREMQEKWRIEEHRNNYKIKNYQHEVNFDQVNNNQQTGAEGYCQKRQRFK